MSAPNHEPPNAPEAKWSVWRIDDNGNTFIVRDHLTFAEAQRLIAEFESRSHKQMYWVEREEEESS